MPNGEISFSEIDTGTVQIPSPSLDVFSRAGISLTPPKPAPREIPISEIEGQASNQISFDTVEKVDSFYRRSQDELTKDKTFDPRQYYSENPDVSSNPEALSKLLEVYRKRREEGISLGGTLKEAVKSAPGTLARIGKGAYQLASNVLEFTGVQPVISETLSLITGMNAEERKALGEESARRAEKAFAETVAGTELSAAGISDLARTGTRKIFGKSPSEQTQQELLKDLSNDVAFRQQLETIKQGGGEALKTVGLDTEKLSKQGIVLDSEAIENLSLVDPATIIATGGLFKVVGTAGKTLATAATRAGAIDVAKVLNSAREIVGKTVSSTGRVATAIGEKGEPVFQTAGALAGTVKAGPFGTLAGIAGGEKFAEAVAAGGRGLTRAGEVIAGPISPGVRKLVDFASVYGKPVTGATKGAAIGTAAAAPLALLTDDDLAAGGILGAGLGIGVTAGAVGGGFGAVKKVAADRYFGEHGKILPEINSPNYGIEPALDAAHASAIESLPIRQRNEINQFRELTRDLGGEFYTLSPEDFTKAISDAYKRETGTEISAETLNRYSQNQAYFSEYRPDAQGNIRKVVLLNGGKGLQHDAGHLFDYSLQPEIRQELRQSINDTFTPEQLAQSKAYYESRLGERISPERAMDEFVAEQFNALFSNVPINELNSPPSLVGKFVDTIAKGAEALGVDLTEGAVTPDLRDPLSVGLRQEFKNAARTLLQPREGGAATVPGVPAATVPGVPAATLPGVPAAPTITTPVRNIRATPAQQNDFAARRNLETGISEAKVLVAKEPEILARVNEISSLMESGNPVIEIEHAGIRSQGRIETPSGRSTRRKEQETGYERLQQLRLENRLNAPGDIINRHQKTFVPIRWTTQGKTPTLIAASLDKSIANIHRIVSEAEKRGASELIPYENSGGKLTDLGWEEAVSDLQAYTQNQSNGFRGDGRRLVRPEGEDIGLSIPGENPDYVPTLLPEGRANFQNLIQGLPTPKTAREIRGQVPGNIKGQIVAEAQGRVPEIPADIALRGKQEFKSFPGRVVREVNPLRNELLSRGVDTGQLLEVTERLRAKDIISVKPRTDLLYKAPITDIVRGGFLPAEGGLEAFSRTVLETSPTEWTTLTGQWQAGLTGEAYRLGLGLKDRADLIVLARNISDIADRTREIIKSGNLDEAMSLVTKGQFFREAYEAATGTGSAKLGVKRIFPDAVFPFEAPDLRTATGEVIPLSGGFLPSEKAATPLTESGRVLEAKGFDIRPYGTPGTRGVEIFKDLEKIGDISSKEFTPGSAEIANVVVKRAARKQGVGETLYRELLTQLQADGVSNIEGTVVSAGPLKIRKKLLGDFESLEINGQPATLEEALTLAQATEALEKRGLRTEVVSIEPRNRLTPEMSFLPREGTERVLPQRGRAEIIPFANIASPATREEK